jgi:tetratricopeptide (TPR) repeat protein
MKRIFLSLALLGYLSLCFTQPLIQKGLVRELNSGKQPISAVEIIFEGAATTYSDGVGNFRLVFQDKKPGDLIFKESIRKKGYELVNEKDFGIVKISSTERLGVDIILAKAGTVDAAKKEYYDVSDAALLASFDREKRALRRQLQEEKINAEKYQSDFKALGEQYDIQKATLDELSEKFARVNFDDVEPYYEEALKLFKAGKIDEAIQILEGADPTKRTQQILAEEKRLNLAQAELDSQKVALAREKKKQIEAVRLLADMYSLKFDPIKAEQQFDQLVLLDSTDLEIIYDAANFYQEQHRYGKALVLYPKVINHPNAEVWQKVNAYGDIGEIQTKTGKLEKAMKAFKRYSQAYDTLYQNTPSYTLYKHNLAVSYSKLGKTYKSLGDLDTALYYFKERSRLGKELYESYPSNVNFKYGLAVSYSKLGETYMSLGNLDSVLYYFRERSRLGKELYESYPTNVRFMYGLAISYSRLGEAYKSLGDLDTALYFYLEDLKLTRGLYTSYASNVEFKYGLAVSYSKLGETYMSLGDLDSALYYYQEDLKLTKVLYASYPTNVKFKYALATSNSKLGETYTSLRSLDSALYYYQESLKLTKGLCASHPSNVRFKYGLAVSYSKLGETYMSLGNLDSALYYYQEDLKLTKALYSLYPSNVEFKYGLALSYKWFAWFYEQELNEVEKAKDYYKASEKLLLELTESFPAYVEFKSNLDWVQDSLSIINDAEKD